MQKQFYILVKGEKIHVDEATYRAYKRPVWKEKKREAKEKPAPAKAAKAKPSPER